MSQTPVRSGLPSGRRGMEACGETATGSPGPDCAKRPVPMNENAANAAVEIKQGLKWFFTWKPSQAGVDGPDSLRVLLYHCEILASPALAFLWPGRANQRLAALRAALQPQSGHHFDGSLRRSLYGFLSLRVWGLDQEKSDPARSG